MAAQASSGHVHGETSCRTRLPGGGSGLPAPPRAEVSLHSCRKTGPRHVGDGRGGLGCRVAGYLERSEFACARTPDQRDSALATQGRGRI